MKINNFSLLILAVFVLRSSVLFGADIQKNSGDQDSIFLNFKNTKIDISHDEINGISREVLYRSNGTKISQLNWDIKNLKMTTLGFSTDLEDFATFKIRYGNSINKQSRKARMTDYDWYNTDGDTNPDSWTHYSLSEAKIDFAQDFEILTAYKIPQANFLRINLGFRHHHIKWRDAAISYIYSSNDNKGNLTGFRNVTGKLNNQNLVTYQQKFNTPYIGISCEKNFFNNKLSTNLFANYSNLVYAEAYDIHHDFNDRYRENYSNGKFINYGGSLNASIYKNFELGLAYETIKYPLNKGTLKISKENKAYVKSNQPVGISSRFNKFSIVLKYHFDLNNFTKL